MRWLALFLLSFLFNFGLSSPFEAIKVKKIGDDVHVSWRIDEKVTYMDFIIQRSLDNQEFEAISIVTGDGNRLSSFTFGFVDENVVAHDSDVLFYRVVAVGKNSKNEASDVVSVAQQESKGLIIDYFKIPEQPETLFVAYRANGEGELFLQVFAPSGASIFYKKIPYGPGFQVVEVPVNILSEGDFRIQLFDDVYAVEKLIKL